jgi:hypothetical protein
MGWGSANDIKRKKAGIEFCSELRHVYSEAGTASSKKRRKTVVAALVRVNKGDRSIVTWSIYDVSR